MLGERGEDHKRPLRSASETAVQAWLRRWCEREQVASRFTPHDWRRTFATRLGDLGIAPHVIAKLLNHTRDASSSTAVYARGEYEAERIESTEKWAAHLIMLVR